MIDNDCLITVHTILTQTDRQTDRQSVVVITWLFWKQVSTAAVILHWSSWWMVMYSPCLLSMLFIFPTSNWLGTVWPLLYV